MEPDQLHIGLSPTKEYATIPPQEFDTRRMALARLLARGWKPSELKVKFGVTDSYITRTKAHPLYQDFIMEYHAKAVDEALEIEREAQGMAHLALATLHEQLLEADEEGMSREPQRARQNRISFKILDIATSSKRTPSVSIGKIENIESLNTTDILNNVLNIAKEVK